MVSNDKYFSWIFPPDLGKKENASKGDFGKSNKTFFVNNYYINNYGKLALNYLSNGKNKGVFCNKSC